jgi:RNA polymerase sigma factor for flagellar operon FliA
MDVSLDEVEALVVDTQPVHVVSLNKRTYENDGNRRDATEIDNIADRRAEDPTQRARNIDLMRTVTRGLSKTERLIIILYYYEELTMKEIGETLGLSESRVSQMHKVLVERLRVRIGKRRSDLAA